MQIKNEVLWVYNLEHLQHIESYIKATQRKQLFRVKNSGYQIKRSRNVVLSFSQQLPQKIKQGSNRVAVLHALSLLREMLTRAGDVA